MAEQFRSTAIPNMAEYFGCDASDVFDAKEQAEGYLAGVAFAKYIHEAIHKDYGERSKIYREAILRGLTENL